MPVTKGQVPQPASLRVGRSAMAAPACGRTEGNTAPYLGAALGAGPEPKQLRLGDTHSHEESNIFIKQILMFMSPEHMNDLLMIRTTFDVHL